MYPIKEAEYQSFEFDIYKTLKLANYDKKFEGGGSGWCSLFNKKNGKKLTLSTVETYDIFMNPEQYGIETIDTKQAFKNNYITLETLNTIYLIAEKEDWHYLV
jgi:hypothetical protein